MRNPQSRWLYCPKCGCRTWRTLDNDYICDAATHGRIDPQVSYRHNSIAPTESAEAFQARQQ